MSLLDSLLKADASVADEKETAHFYSKKLARVLGSKEAVRITLTELSSRRLSELMDMQLDKKGKPDLKKVLRSQALMAAESITDPDLRDRKLLSHFGCDNAADLATKLFGGELARLSDKIMELSGFTDEEDEVDAEIEEIKNSSAVTDKEE